MINKQENIIYTYLPLVLGMVSGIVLFFSFFNKMEIIYTSLLDKYYVGNLSNYMINFSAKYIIIKKLSVVLLYIFLIILFSYRITAFFINYVFGVYYALIASVIYFIFGLKGVVFILILFTPHFILYFNSFVLFLNWFCFRKDLFYNTVNKFNTFVRFMIILILSILGICWEIFFQKNFMDIFSRYSI